MFQCPSCSRFIEMSFPECIVITAESLTDPRIEESYYKCSLCDAKLHHENKIDFLRHKERGGNAHFVPTNTESRGRGFHINQMYSMAKAGKPDRLAFAYLMSLTDPTYEQEFFNSKLAKCHAVEGAKVTDEHLTKCTGQYKKGTTSNVSTIVTMGIDVGAVLHIVIREWFFDNPYPTPGLSINDIATSRILYEGTSSGKMDDFDEAEELFKQYGCITGIVDAEPERRAALQFAQKLYGRILLCDYMFSQQGKEATVNEDECSIKVNRTAWMDLSLGRYKNQTTQIPVDASLQFKTQIKEPVRIYKEDKWGGKYGVYESVKADHFAHADTYAEIALGFGVSIATNQDIHGMY